MLRNLDSGIILEIVVVVVWEKPGLLWNVMDGIKIPKVKLHANHN